MKHSGKKLYCVIGYPIRHSLSPRLHNRAFRKLKIAAQYEAIKVHPQNLAKFMRTFRGKYAGGNVTIPHKVAVMKFLDKVSPEARAIGAVNTIVSRKGKLMGYNTDMFGAVAAIKQGTGKKRKKTKNGERSGKFLHGKHAIILGAGGAARAVVYGLKKAGAKVTILNRTPAYAKKLAKDFRCNYGSLPMSLQVLRSNPFVKCDILINTTSVGMWPHIKETPLPRLKTLLQNGKSKPIVMDIIYRPRMTKLLRDARASHCRIITGDRMFLGQAAKAFELWTGKKMPQTQK